jgi:hypothetical protein
LGLHEFGFGINKHFNQPKGPQDVLYRFQGPPLLVPGSAGKSGISVNHKESRNQRNNSYALNPTFAAKVV